MNAAKLQSSQIANKRAWTLFAWCIICQVGGGTPYWFPSIGEGLRNGLALTPGQLTAVLAASNAGSILGFIGGVLYKRVGAKKTTIYGALSTSFSYLLLAFLVAIKARGMFVFVLAFLAALCIVTTAFFVYSSAMAVVTSSFSQQKRGRVMAFHSAIFGMSAGVTGSMQEAFANDVGDTVKVLIGVALYTAIPAVVAFFMFPGVSSNDRIVEDEESAPLLGETQISRVHNRRSASDETLFSAAFAIALLIVVALQLNVYFSWSDASAVVVPLLGTSLKPQIVCAAAIICLLSSFLVLPQFAAGRGAPVIIGGDVDDSVATPFKEVVMDIRYQLILLAFFVLPGSGSIGTLVNAAELVTSRKFSSYAGGLVPVDIGTGDSVARAVRALVIAFSAMNLLSRLVAVTYTDIGGNSWKLRLLQADALLMGAAMCGVAYGSGLGLVIAVAAVGYAHGTFFAISPTLVAEWFGVAGFPLNFAVAGAAWTAATSTTASILPSIVAGFVAQSSFVDLLSGEGESGSDRFCSGTWCYAPTFGFIAIMCVGLSVTFHLLHDRISRISSK